MAQLKRASCVRPIATAKKQQHLMHWHIHMLSRTVPGIDVKHDG